MTKQEKLAAYLLSLYNTGYGDGSDGSDYIFALSEEFPMNNAEAHQMLKDNEHSKLGDKSIKDHAMIMADLILNELSF
jgi:hypothetical protein